MQINTLHHNEWLSLKEIVDPERGVNGYVFSHETRCRGKIIAVLPFRFVDSEWYRYKIEFGLRSEVTPCWGMDPQISALTGGYEGGDPRQTAIHELKEEAGFDVGIDELVDLGTSYASKSSDTVYHLYAVDVTGKEQGEALGDGHRLDVEGTIVWTDNPESCDPQVSVMLLRLRERWWSILTGQEN